MKKPSKKLTIGAIVIVLVAAAAGIGYWALNRNDKADEKNYASLQKATDELRKSYDELEKTFNTYTDDTQTEEEKTAYDKAQEKYDAAVADYKIKVDDIDDEEVTKAYDAFIGSSNAFVEYTIGYIEDASKARSLQDSECMTFQLGEALGGSQDVSAVFTETVKDCEPLVREVASSSNAGIAAYGKAVQDYLKERTAKVQTIKEAATGGELAAITNATNAFLSVKVPDINAELGEARNDITVVKLLETLSNVVATKTADTVSKE